MGEIYVTGSGGFIGKHLMKALPDAIPVDPQEACCRDADDTVIHLANKVARTYMDYMENVRSMGNMLTQSIEGGKIVYLSSSVVYMPEPSLYRASKLACEELCNCFRDKLRISVIRPFNVYGPGQPDEYVIPTIINQMLTCDNGDHIFLNNWGASRTFIYVEDLAKSIPYMPEGTWDTSGIYMGMRDVAEKAAFLIGKQFLTEGPSFPDEGAKTLFSDPNITDMEIGLTKTIEYYKQRREEKVVV